MLHFVNSFQKIYVNYINQGKQHLMQKSDPLHHDGCKLLVLLSFLYVKQNLAI